jgi:hypothetical protein
MESGDGCLESRGTTVLEAGPGGLALRLSEGLGHADAELSLPEYHLNAAEWIESRKCWLQ